MFEISLLFNTSKPVGGMTRTIRRLIRFIDFLLYFIQDPVIITR